MLVVILNNTETPTHSLKKGDIVDLQSHLAALLINSKDAKLPSKKQKESFNNGN